MADSFEKRQRERRKQQKRREKALRRKDRAVQKAEDGPAGVQWIELDELLEGQPGEEPAAGKGSDEAGAPQKPPPGKGGAPEP